MFKSIQWRWRQGGFDRFEVIAALAFLLLLIPTLRGISNESDLDIFFGAAQRLRAGQNMYLSPYLYGMWYYYSPLFASLIVPFTFVNLMVLKVVWFFLNLFLLYRLYQILQKFLSIPRNKNGMWLISILGILAYHPVFLNLIYGQLTIFVLWCSLEGAYQALKNKNLKAVLSFGIGINIKVLPIFFFYHYLLKRNLRLILAMLAAIVFFVALPYLWIPSHLHSGMIYNWLDLLNPLNDEHINTVGEGGFTDFASMATKYLTSMRIPTEAPANIASLNESQIFWLQMTLRLLILVAVAWVYRKVHSKLTEGSEKEFADVSFLLLCIPAAFPHQRDYSVLLCVPSFAWLLFLYFGKGYRVPIFVNVLALIALTAMGSTVFFEFFGRSVKDFICKSRLVGFGNLMYLIVYLIWMLKAVQRNDIGRLAS